MIDALPTALADALGDRVFAELVRIGADLHAVVLCRGRAHRFALGSHDEVAQEVRLVRFALRRLAGDGPAGDTAAGLAQSAGRLESLLLGGWRRLLDDQELVLSPTGALHGLPWAVLPALRGRPVSLAPSALAWLQARTAARSPDAAGGRVLLVAGPGLAHADAEIAELAARYPRAEVLRGPAATVDAVRRGLDGASLAHIAAHGEFRAGNPLFSQLRLADGPLMGHDLELLDAAPGMVVLSACDAGRAGAGDAVIGLTGLLLALGTATVIASVTPVHDAAASTFMTGFHAALDRIGAPCRALAAVPRSAGVLGFGCFGAG